MRSFRKKAAGGNGEKPPAAVGALSRPTGRKLARSCASTLDTLGPTRVSLSRAGIDVVRIIDCGAWAVLQLELATSPQPPGYDGTRPESPPDSRKR